MAWNHDHAARLRAALAHLPDGAEKPMFGGLAFLTRGHMVAGIHNGVMLRVGKPNIAAALAHPGTSPATMKNGRPMIGMIMLGDDLAADPARLQPLLDIATGFVSALPPK